jgi:hypothetical protein
MTLRPMASLQQPGLLQRREERRVVRAALGIGLYPIANFQYTSTTLYQVSYHIQYLFFLSDNRILPYLGRVEQAWRLRSLPDAVRIPSVVLHDCETYSWAAPRWRNKTRTALAQIARLGPTLVTESPYQSPKAGPQFGPTLENFRSLAPTSAATWTCASSAARIRYRALGNAGASPPAAVRTIPFGTERDYLTEHAVHLTEP